MFSGPGAASPAFYPGGFVNVFPSPLSFGRRPYLVPAALAQAAAAPSSTHTLSTGPRRSWGPRVLHQLLARSPPSPPSASLRLRSMYVSSQFSVLSLSSFSLFFLSSSLSLNCVSLPGFLLLSLFACIYLPLCLCLSQCLSLGVLENLFRMIVLFLTLCFFPSLSPSLICHYLLTLCSVCVCLSLSL